MRDIADELGLALLLYGEVAHFGLRLSLRRRSLGRAGRFVSFIGAMTTLASRQEGLCVLVERGEGSAM
ncbi:MAG: hypothetical protein ACLT98_01235 [Eggerthellaceae bacterium]